MSENAETPTTASTPMFEDMSKKVETPDADVDEALEAYRQSLKQEMDQRADPTNAREAAKATREVITRSLHDYLANMRGLAMGAISESVKYNANKFLIEAVLSQGGVGAKDPLADFLEEMEAEANKPKVETTEE